MLEREMKMQGIPIILKLNIYTEVSSQNKRLKKANTIENNRKCYVTLPKM